jgi:hypothetical protein
MKNDEVSTQRYNKTRSLYIVVKGNVIAIKYIAWGHDMSVFHS